MKSGVIGKNAGKTEVFYLSSYSPELNSDELLSAGLNQRVTIAASAKTGWALA
jgi:hypothetical protein